jgi:hypothetical protein
MAVLATTHPTLLDFAKRLDPNDKIAKLVEVLNEQNEIIEDIVFVEGNLLTGHRTTIRSGIPTPTWRKLYGGVQPTKSTSVQVTDSCGSLEAYAEVDKKLADLNGNTADWRFSEDLAHIEGLHQEFAQTLFYGNEGSEPEAFTGFAPRFNAIAGAENGINVISADGSPSGADQTSIWLIVWGPNTVHGIYPKGSKAGLTVEDKGQVTLETAPSSGGGRMEAYRTHFGWDVGLTVRDWRSVVRGCNIDVGNLNKNPATAGPDLIDLMTRMSEAVQSLNSGRPVFYVNRTVRSFLRRQIVTKIAPATLTAEKVAGKHVTMFDGIPVRRVDQLLSTESVIS